MVAWMVIYPKGNRQRLCITQVLDYEKSEYDLASTEEFEDEDKCRGFMIQLAKRHKLRYSGDTAYLD